MTAPACPILVSAIWLTLGLSANPDYFPLILPESEFDAVSHCSNRIVS